MDSLSISQSFRLASRAREKLSKAARKSDHDLRVLVSHANLLDALMSHLSNFDIPSHSSSSSLVLPSSTGHDYFYEYDSDSDSDEDEDGSDDGSDGSEDDDEVDRLVDNDYDDLDDLDDGFGLEAMRSQLINSHSAPSSPRVLPSPSSSSPIFSLSLSDSDSDDDDDEKEIYSDSDDSEDDGPDSFYSSANMHRFVAREVSADSSDDLNADLPELVRVVSHAVAPHALIPDSCSDESDSSSSSSYTTSDDDDEHNPDHLALPPPVYTPVCSPQHVHFEKQCPPSATLVDVA